METASTRALTLLVTDVVASTELLTSIGDVAGRPLLDEVERVTSSCIEEHGGTIVKAMGDGLLTTFASTRRAVACAIAIQRSVVDNPIGVRVAVHVGEVAEHDGDILGAAVHVVARLASVTRGGQIVVSDVVKHMLLATPEITLRDLGPRELKGIPTPMLLHEVVWDESTASRAPRRMSGDVSIVGRDVQLRAVQPAIDGVLAGRGQLVVVTGEPGIGKTTLATEICRRLERQGARVVWATCWDGDGAPPLWPWVQVLREVMSMLPADLTPTLGDQQLHEVGRLVGEADGVATPTTSEESADARFRLFDAIGQLLAGAARVDPLVIVIDDAQWADIASLQLVEFLAAQIRGTAVMGLVTYRDVEIGPDHVLAPIAARLNRLATTVSLTGLESDCVALLVESLSGRSLDADELEALQRRSLGNPFFVRELTQLGKTGAVPDTVREIVTERLSRLPETCRSLLTTAAVIGQECDLALLARSTEQSVGHILDELDLAVAARVLVPSDTGMPRWRFAHDLFRETIESALPRGRRAELHHRVGSALVALRSEGRPVAASVLAEHFGNAASLGGADLAFRFAREAAAEASAALAYDEAVRWLERATELIELSDPVDRVQLLEVTLDHTEALTLAGRLGEARDRLVAAADDARRVGRPDLLARAALGVHRLGTATAIPNEELVALLDAAITEQPPGDTVLLAQLLAALAMATYHAGVGRTDTTAARGHALRAVTVARAIGDEPTLLRALLAYHDTIWVPGSAEDRLEVATEATRLAERTKQGELLFEAKLARATALGELGSAETETELEECCALAEQLGQPRLRYMALTRRSTLALMRGDLVGAEASAAEGAVLAASIEHPDSTIVEFVQLWQIRWLQDRACEIDETLLRHARTRWGLESTWVQKAWVEIERGDLAEAAHLAAPFLDGWSEWPVDYIWLASAIDVALLVAEIGTAAQQRESYYHLLPHVDSFVFVGGCVTVAGAAAWAVGVVAEALGELDDAIELHERGLALHRRMRLPIYIAMSEAELARCLTRRAGPGDLARARDLAARARVAALVTGPARVERRLAAVPLEEARGLEAELHRAAAVWTAQFGDKTVRIPDSRGLRDLAELFARPGVEIDATRLFSRDVDAGQPGGADDVLDETARRQYEARLRELTVEMDAADVAGDAARSARAAGEREELLAALRVATGLGGRSRRLGDPSERARKAVSARIRDAIHRLDGLHPELGAHLQASVTTGSRCCYRPEPTVRWSVSSVDSA